MDANFLVNKQREAFIRNMENYLKNLNCLKDNKIKFGEFSYDDEMWFNVDNKLNTALEKLQEFYNDKSNKSKNIVLGNQFWGNDCTLFPFIFLYKYISTVHNNTNRTGLASFNTKIDWIEQAKK